MDYVTGKNRNYPTFKIGDPGVCELNYFDNVDIFGIINTCELKIPFPRTKKMVQRIGVLLPSNEQAIVEIWNSDVENQPVFAKNWESLQLIYIKDISYHGKAKMQNEEIHIFRLSQKNLNFRYIWLSGENFWDEPIAVPDTFDNSETYLEQTQKNGLLQKSNGSRFGNFYQTGYRSDLHTKFIFYPYLFGDYIKFHKAYSKIVLDTPTGWWLNKKRESLTESGELFNRYY